MHIRDVLLDAFGRIDEEMRQSLQGLTAEQLVFRPHEEANSIGWLAWHLARVMDDHMSDLAGRQQAWIVDGWHQRFDKPADPHEVGFGDSAAQVPALRPSNG